MEWYYYRRAILPDSEISEDIHLNSNEVSKLLNQHKALFLRYTSHYDKIFESPAFYVIKDSWNGLEEFSSNTRNQIRKANKMCYTTPIDKEVLCLYGYKVYSSHTLSYQPACINLIQYLQEIKIANNREFYGCFDRESGELIAYAQNVVKEGVMYSQVKANPHYYKSHYPFYALFYNMTEYYLYTLKKKYVCDGFRSLDNHSNIQSFLVEKFKFRQAYCVLHVKYKWWLSLIIKLIFPFRKFIPIKAAKNLLFQEEISRKSLKILAELTHS